MKNAPGVAITCDCGALLDESPASTELCRAAADEREPEPPAPVNIHVHTYIHIYRVPEECMNMKAEMRDLRRQCRRQWRTRK